VPPSQARIKAIALRELPSSIGQRLLWYLDHYRGHDGALNCPVLCRIHGRLDVPALRASIDDLTARHESLRTTFRRRGRDIQQIIHDPQPVPMTELDLAQANAPETGFQEAVARELQTPIDASAWPVRVTLYRIGEEEHALCVNMHHLVTDAWSCGIVLREICLLYERRLGRNSPLPEIPLQYSRFVQWQRESLEGEALRQHQRYWQRQLDNAKLPPLPLDLSRSAAGERQSAREAADIGPAVAESLRQFARTRKTTMFNIMLSAYYALLYRLTGQSDLTIASLFANRQMPEVQQTVGFLANMLLLRTRLGKATRFVDVLSSTHRTVMDAILHQSLPYYVLPIEAIRTGPRRPDDVVFQMMAQPLYNTSMADLAVEVIVPEGVGNRFELELALVPQHGGFRAVLFYNPSRLDGGWTRQFISRYAQITQAVAANPNAALAEL